MNVNITGSSRPQDVANVTFFANAQINTGATLHFDTQFIAGNNSFRGAFGLAIEGSPATNASTTRRGLDLDDAEIDFSEADPGSIPDHCSVADLNESPILALEVFEHEVIVHTADFGVPTADEVVLDKRDVDVPGRASLIGTSSAKHR
jgi:hypothetical protein